MFKFLTNKHVIIAMLVAPILAVLAWIAVGQFAGEQPHSAQPGRDYPLVAQSNCRYASGACDLSNEDFRVRLVLDQSADPVLILSASHPLDGVLLSVGTPEQNLPPERMRAADGQGLEWQVLLGRVPSPQERIRLVATTGGSAYFAEASTLFMVGEQAGQ
jgi:hypothetical protein